LNRSSTGSEITRASTVSRPRRKFGYFGYYLLLVPGVVLTVIFLLLPLVIIVIMSFLTVAPQATGYLPILTLSNYVDFFTLPQTGTIVANTLTLCFTATLICFIFGFPLSYFLVFHVKNVTFKNYLITILLVPFLIDWSIRTVAWIAILGKLGIVNFALMSLGVIKQPLEELLFSRYTLNIIWLQTYVLFMFFPIYLAMNRIDPDLIAAAKVTKAPPHRVLYDIIFKLSLPGVVAGFVFVFVDTIGDYVTPNLWAGGIQTLGLSVARYSKLFDWPYASVLSTMLLLIALVVLFICFKIANVNKLVYE
jgi:ABC-type spermidine/putrescine transport system permease subunit I